VFAQVRDELVKQSFKPLEQITLEPYERDHAVVIGSYRPLPKKKKDGE